MASGRNLSLRTSFRQSARAMPALSSSERRQRLAEAVSVYQLSASFSPASRCRRPHVARMSSQPQDMPDRADRIGRFRRRDVARDCQRSPEADDILAPCCCASPARCFTRLISAGMRARHFWAGSCGAMGAMPHIFIRAALQAGQRQRACRPRRRLFAAGHLRCSLTTVASQRLLQLLSP